MRDSIEVIRGTQVDENIRGQRIASHPEADDINEINLVVAGGRAIADGQPAIRNADNIAAFDPAIKDVRRAIQDGDTFGEDMEMVCVEIRIPADRVNAIRTVG